METILSAFETVVIALVGLDILAIIIIVIAAARRI